MYLCGVTKKQRLQEAAGASQSPANALSRYKKSGYYRNTRPGKRKIKLSSFVAKQRYVFLSVPENYPERKTFFEKIPYKRDPRSVW